MSREMIFHRRHTIFPKSSSTTAESNNISNDFNQESNVAPVNHSLVDVNLSAPVASQNSQSELPHKTSLNLNAKEKMKSKQSINPEKTPPRSPITRSKGKAKVVVEPPKPAKTTSRNLPFKPPTSKNIKQEFGNAPTRKWEFPRMSEVSSTSVGNTASSNVNPLTNLPATSFQSNNQAPRDISDQVTNYLAESTEKLKQIMKETGIAPTKQYKPKPVVKRTAKKKL